MFIEKFLHRNNDRVNQDETFLSFWGEGFEWFLCERRGIEIMKSYIRSLLFFCVSLHFPPSFSSSFLKKKTPLNIAQMKNQIIYELSPLLLLFILSQQKSSEICYSGCLIVEECSELHIKLNDCGNVYLLAISKLHGSLNNWVNIHHVWRCWALLITLQCCND